MDGNLLPFPLYSFSYFSKLTCNHVIYRGAPWLIQLQCPVCDRRDVGLTWKPVRKEDVPWAS